MKFYHTINAAGHVELVDTQQQSKAAGVKTPKPFEVPTDKDGLRDFLNKLYAQIDPLAKPPETPTIGDGGDGSVARAILAEMDRAANPVPPGLPSRDDVEDYILECEGVDFRNIFLVFAERLERWKREANDLAVSRISAD